MPPPRPRPEITTRRITAEETKDLRHAILWPTIARDDQLYPYDADPRTVQLGAFLSSTPADTDVPEAYLPRGGGKCRPSQGERSHHATMHAPASSDPCDPTCTAEAAASGDPGRADPSHDTHPHHHAHAPVRQEPCGILTLVVEPYLGLRGDATPLPETQIQLRKFAVIRELQGHGVGRRMLDAAIAEVGRMRDDLVRLAAKAEPGPALLHLDARKEQVGFYERVGCKVLDPEVFAKRGAGGQGPAIDHVRMGRVVQ